MVEPNGPKVECDLLPFFMNRHPAGGPAFYERYSTKDLETIAGFLARLSPEEIRT